jgi:hypothetical protein
MLKSLAPDQLKPQQAVRQHQLPQALMLLLLRLLLLLCLLVLLVLLQLLLQHALMLQLQPLLRQRAVHCHCQHPFQ